VEPGAACALDEVVQNAGKRLQELVKNVDRFTATELVTDESVNKWDCHRVRKGPVRLHRFHGGNAPRRAERGGVSRTQILFERISGDGNHQRPAGVGGYFHPYYAGNYEMTCEGLVRWNGGLAWQVHFRQRPDKPTQSAAIVTVRKGKDIRSH